MSSASGYGGSERDRDVPTLGLGPNVLAKEEDGKKSGTFKLGNVVPNWGRRGSVQLFGKTELRNDDGVSTPTVARASKRENDTDSLRSSICEVSDG